MFALAIDTNQVGTYLSNVNWLEPSWDLFIILFFVVASLMYGLSLGRDRLLVILVSIYMSLAVVEYVPFITNFNASININDTFALRVSVFLGIFIILFFFLSQSALMRTLGVNSEHGPMWQVITFSILHVGLLISVTLSFFPSEAAGVLSPLTRILFVGDVAKAVWILLPVFAMSFIGRSKSDA
ncbi:hypothetical protein A2348_01570 [Candidatus Uhrbacteria bacterium RIFOXYB12_FULL_58_10]|nr:MAG: hypothetical protein A2348_01570 [Candidatus Uhrbacteria bacterium RIFOXYB12_FULL_58_10]